MDQDNSPRNLALAAEAWLQLALARLMVLGLPFRWVTRSCGTHMAESPYDVPESHQALAEGVGKAIARARYHTQWDSNCLAQGIAAQRMLRRRGVPSTLYLGVAKADPDAYDIHAWLRCGNRVLTGDNLRERFTPILSLAPDDSGAP